MPSHIPSLSRNELARRYPEDHNLTRAGGFNQSIVVVHDHHTPLNPFTRRKALIKKVFLPQDVLDGHAAREIAYLKQLNSCIGICGLVAYSLEPETGYGAMIMPRYSHGSLAKLMSLHQRANVPIPRDFIWKVFLALAEALTYNRYGPAPHQDGWNFIIHRDIHPGNVLLSPLSATQYPLVALADFGCGIDSVRYGANCVPPHGVFQTRRHREYVTPETPFSRSKSDVYQMGFVIVSLCKLSLTPRGFSERYPAGRKEGNALNRLLRRCLEKDYKKRIDAKELRDELRGKFRRMMGGEERLLLAGPLDAFL